MSRAFDSRRRSFLIRGGRAASALLLPRTNAQTAPLVDAEFHLHPQYRAETPLEAALAKIRPGSDEFISERYHDQIAPILTTWREELLHSPSGVSAIERVLSPGFQGIALGSSESRVVRRGPALEVHRVAFPPAASLAGDAFSGQLRNWLGGFSKILTAELQITGTEVQSGAVQTRVRYEIVGEGAGYHREQRVGLWDLTWESGPGDGFRLLRWHAGEETRSRSAKPWFEDIAPRAFADNATWATQFNRGVDDWRTILDGASGIDIYGHNGVSVGDIDGDGFDDLYVCQPAGLPNRLYRNRGDGTFEDITESSGVGLLDHTACALFADFSHNGRQDLVVVRTTGPLLYLNAGGGRFRLRPDAFQFANPPQGTFTGAAAADYDRDGWLDIYFSLYTYYQGTDQYRYPTPYYDAENGPPNFLMRSNRDGTFRDVTKQSGLDRNNTRYSFCCAWGDYNRDGWPDLYVVNDFGRKNLYRNNGDGTFTDVAAEAGVEDTGAGMSGAWFDYDSDGADDLYVANMWTAAGVRISAQEKFQPGAPESVRALYRQHAMGNAMFRNRGMGAFEDATMITGTGNGRWAWSSDAWDFDHDGFADLYIVNGFLSQPLREDLNSYFWRQVVARSPNTAQPSQLYEQGWAVVNELIRADHSWSGYERNAVYANNRDGTFSDVSGAVDLDFIEDGRSFALADFDHDGRQEMLLKSRNAPQMRLLKNVIEDLPPAIAFRLRGVRSNPDAVGARITVETGSGRQTRTLRAGSAFLCQHSKDLFFGLGDAKGPVTASIRWPSGLVQELDNLPANHSIFVEEGHAPARLEPFAKQPARKLLSPRPASSLPATIETWLLAPVPAPDLALPGDKTSTLSSMRGKPLLLCFGTANTTWPVLDNLARLCVSFDAGVPQGLEEVAGVYNLLYRYLFDRHRDLTLPTSFLIDARGDIVRVYQGPLDAKRAENDARRIPQTSGERIALGLPFKGNAETYAFGRNHLALGSVFFQHGYYDQAVAFFRFALGDDPSSAEANYGIGSVYLKQGKIAGARASFEQALKLTPGFPDTEPNARNNLGLIAAREGRTDEAIRYFEETIRLSPDYWIALENLGNAYRQQRRWADARATLERAVAARPDDPEANYSLAMVYAQMDDIARAYQYLQKALLLRPVYPEALNNLGVLNLRTRRRDDAVARFEECIRVAPAFDQAYLNLARVYVIEGNREKARAVLLDLLKQHPGHPRAQQALDQLR